MRTKRDVLDCQNFVVPAPIAESRAPHSGSERIPIIKDEPKAVAEHSLTIFVRGTAGAFCDSEMPRGILANFMYNAARHTAAGCHIDLTVREVGATVLRSGRDDGQGVPV